MHGLLKTISLLLTRTFVLENLRDEYLPEYNSVLREKQAKNNFGRTKQHLNSDRRTKYVSHMKQRLNKTTGKTSTFVNTIVEMKNKNNNKRDSHFFNSIHLDF